MPFTNSPLSDDDLDALLGGASARLGGVADRVAIGPAPAPSSGAGPRLAAVAAVGVAVAGLATVLVVSRDGGGAPASLPPGFADGRYGTEVSIEEVDDGDGNADTVLLRIRPVTDVGTVGIRRNGAARAVATATTAAATADPDTTGAPAVAPEVCIDSPGAGGVCGTAAQLAEPMLHVGQRGSSGTALVTGVPADVTAVAFVAGPERHWQRPREGVALFPFDADASPDAAVSLVRSDGSEAARLTGHDGFLTDAEVAALAPSARTGAELPAVWLASTTPSLAATYGTWLRRVERPTATGFPGPLVIQGFGEGNPGLDASGVFLVTVRTDQVEAARGRLALTTSGQVRRSLDHSDGTTTLVWARRATTDEEIDGLLATMTAREPVPGETIDLTSPWSWRGQRTGPYVSTEVDATMFGSLVGTVELEGRERQIWATADDLGAVRFASIHNVADGRSLGGMTVERNGPFALPAAGDRLVAGFMLVPSATTSLRVTFDDGTAVTPELLDVRPIADARLALIGRDGTVRSVDPD